MMLKYNDFRDADAALSGARDAASQTQSEE